MKQPLPNDPRPPELEYLDANNQTIKYAETPGGLADAFMRNERAALVVLPDKTRIVFTYTSK